MTHALLLPLCIRSAVIGGGGLNWLYTYDIRARIKGVFSTIRGSGVVMTGVRVVVGIGRRS